MDGVKYIVTDTSPLINLYNGEVLNYLFELFEPLGDTLFYIPEIVMGEIKYKYGPLKKELYNFYYNNSNVEIITIIKKDYSNCLSDVMTDIASNSEDENFNPGEHEAESQVICFGKGIGSDFLLMDEVSARDVAEKKGLKSLNHVDIIILCMQNGLITKNQASSCINKIIKTGYVYSYDIRTILEDAGIGS